MITDAEILELEDLIHEEEIDEARDNLLKFTEKTMERFVAADFQKVYYKILDLFAKGKIKKLMVTEPPQHGKSEGSTRRLPAFMFGRNPNTKIGVVSYNSTFARKFNRDIQKIIDTPLYHEIFPDTILNESKFAVEQLTALRNSEEFEIVGKEGSLKAVGRGGALTGSSIDIMIMDDLYKDFEEGNSPVIRDSTWDWYITVANSRLHNNSQQLIVFTRWNEDDLIGRLEKKEEVITVTKFDQLKNVPEEAWVKINFEAIMTQEKTEFDQREKGEPLWPDRHSLAKLERVRKLDPEKFNCLYQGDPQSKEGLLYKPFATYDSLPEIQIIKNYTDTADKGSDFLCSIVYAKSMTDERYYVIDVLYTQDSMETTEPETIDLLLRNKVNEADIESNNGGRGFARVIETASRIPINMFNQSTNKEARIISQSAVVNRQIVFPVGWEQRWPEFYTHVTHFKKLFRANKHDDAADTLTGIIEMNIEDEQVIGW